MNLIEEANNAFYNEDEPIISDEEFSLLSSHGLETKNFRTKADHNVPMGSLKKIKTKGDYESWVKDNHCIITPKLDGNSIELIFQDRKLIKGITRGNGYIGNDITDKIIHTNYPLPDEDGLVSLKCEAIIGLQHQHLFEKNIRNVVAGILNQKEVDIEKLKLVDVIAFNELASCTTKEYDTYEKLEELFHKLKENYSSYVTGNHYAIDGLVVEALEGEFENKNPLLPDNIIALKFNKEGVDATIGNIEWNLGKHGRLTPVIVLDNPVNIGGSSVSRVSASNYGIVKEAKLGVGANVKVILSGDIIPYITEVTTPVEFNLDIICPNCGDVAIISDNGVHAICERCSYDELTHLKHIFSVFDLEYISDSTIESLYNKGYNSLSMIFGMSHSAIAKLDGFGEKKANNIIAKLKSIELTEAQILKCAMVQGLGETQCQKLVSHFGSIDAFLNNEKHIMDIDGFGEKLNKQVANNLYKFINMYYLLLDCGVKVKQTKVVTNKPTICFTGTCSKYGRKELTKLLETSYSIHGDVKKDTDILLVDNINSGSSKIKKATKLGVKVIHYDDFLTGELEK